MPSPTRKRLGAAVVALVIVAGIAAVLLSSDARAFAAGVVAQLRSAGPWPFFAAMAVLPVFGMPLSAFTLVAGPVFGPTLGLGVVVACSVGAIAVNVTLSYVLAAYALRPLAEAVVRWLEYPLPHISRQKAFLAIVVLRVVPLTPFFLQGLMLGLARVPFGMYLLISVLIPSCYATSLILLGDGLMRGDRWAIAGAGAMFVMVGIVLHILRKRLPRTPPEENLPMSRP